MNLEPLAWVLGAVFLGSMVVREGVKQRELESRVPIGAAELRRSLGKVQVIDARPEIAGYSRPRIPGAVPFPDCAGDLPAEAERSVPAVIVSADGDRATFERCKATFKAARNLAGGMEAWTAASFPEDAAPSHAPAGCL